LLRAEGIAVHAAVAPSETRVFVAVREHDTGRSLLLNPRGPACGSAEEDALLRAVARTAANGGWVVSSGSVPPGFGVDFHARVRDVALTTGARVVVDSDGRGLREAAPGCALLAPNVPEAERLLDRRIAGVRDAASAARALLSSGARHAAITMGAEGAVLTSADAPEVFHAQAPDAPRGASAVGAGDAFLAALLLRLDVAPARDALRYAVAAGTAVLYGEGAELLRAEIVDRLLPSINAEEAG
ncbi:MAG: PfkB family carbohydrate kinase, partial [Longimicrobiales bacterium]